MSVEEWDKLEPGTGWIWPSEWPGDWNLTCRDENNVALTWRFSRNQRHLAVQYAKRRGFRVVGTPPALLTAAWTRDR